jgi:IS4 transposase
MKPRECIFFLTNQFTLPATICALYKSRWQVELFFKWIKQHLRIKAFYGTSENAVKTQIWIALSVYLLALLSGYKWNRISWLEVSSRWEREPQA